MKTTNTIKVSYRFKGINLKWQHIAQLITQQKKIGKIFTKKLKYLIR